MLSTGLPTFVSAAAQPCQTLLAIILALGHQSWEDASFEVYLYAASIRSIRVSGYLTLGVLEEHKLTSGMIWTPLTHHSISQ